MLIGLVILLAIILFKFNARLKNDDLRAIQKAQNGMQRAQESFSARMQELMDISDSLADLISEEKIDSVGIHEYLRTTLKNNKDVFGFGVGFEPYTFSEKRRLWAPFYIRPNDSIRCELIEDSYDYSVKEWYTRPLHEGAEWFEPPYIGVVSQKLMAEYSVPFYRTNSETGEKDTIGIVYLDYTLEDITKAVKALDLGKSGYGFMFSRGGTVIAHPVASYVKEKKDIEQFAKEWQNPVVTQLFEKGHKSSKPFLELTNPNNNSMCRMFFREIPESGWRLGAIFVEDAFKTDADYKNRNVIIIICISEFILLTLIAIWLASKKFSIPSIQVGIPIASICLLLAIVAIWLSKVSQPYNLFQQAKSTPITEKTVLEKFMYDEDSLRTYYKEPPLIRIPTGVFIKHIEFDGSHNIKFSGIVWQKFHNSIDTNIVKPDVFFLETAPDAEAQNYKRIYTKVGKDYTTIGWYFRLEVRERLHYGLYPFDRENIRLAVSHPDISQPIQLVPDLEAYDSNNPTELPGVDQNLVLPEWQLEEGYFDYKTNFYNTNFGALGEFDNGNRHELYYNLVIRRNFFWPFMTNIIPLTTIAILLYLSVISIRKSDKNKPLGFSGFGFLELCTAFLFVAILTHIDLRANVLVNYVIYMDYFYFHIYLIIIAYSFAAVFYSKSPSRTSFRMPKLLYWPVLLGSLFLFTAVLFY